MEIYLKESAFENGFCKMTAILPQPQCINTLFVKYHDLTFSPVLEVVYALCLRLIINAIIRCSLQLV